MKQLIKFLAIFILTIFGVSCVGKPTPANAETIYIGPERLECEGAFPQLCYQFKKEPTADWTYFYDEIEGFEWEEDYTYELLVSIHSVDNPPADGSSLRYELVEVVSKE